MKLRIAILTFCLLAALPAGAQPVPGEGFADVPGGPVWYKVTGTGDGVPLLVLHGGPGGTSCGYSRLDPLGEQRPVIRYDQLGSGRSGRPEDPSLWNVERFVEALDVLRHQLGLERMHLLGHSWGGALAAAYVIEKGSDGIVSLTLSSPLLSTADWIEDANALRAELPADVREALDRHEADGTTDSEEYRAATEEFYRLHVYGGERGKPPAECAGAPGNSVIYNMMWGPTEFRATGTLIDFDVTDRLGEIKAPLLFIAGEFDEARPQRMAQFQQLVPGSELVIIRDAAHGTLSRHPDAYMAVLERFLEQAERRASD